MEPVCNARSLLAAASNPVRHPESPVVAHGWNNRGGRRGLPETEVVSEVLKKAVSWELPERWGVVGVMSGSTCDFWAHRWHL